jgi:hypothetical protein
LAENAVAETQQAQEISTPLASARVRFLGSV